MKKISVMAVALAAGVFVLSSCNGKSNGAGGDADSTKVDSVKMSSMGSWDYPEGSALQNPDDISCVLYASSLVLEILKAHSNFDCLVLRVYLKHFLPFYLIHFSQ